jgi:pimeloyl-ACP methyl ester carboxylesterase
MRRCNVGRFKNEPARAHFLSIYQTPMAQLPPVSESTDAPTLFGTVRAYRGWTVANYAVRRPGRAASLTLLDPVFTFGRVPTKSMLIAAGMFLPLPDSVQRKVFSWISGGADVDDSMSEAALISAGSTDFVLRKAMPKLFTDDQLRSLGIPVLALIAGRSVMLDAARAAARARNLLPRGQVELWADASHAINGEYPAEIAETAAAFWDEDGA